MGGIGDEGGGGSSGSKSIVGDVKERGMEENEIILFMTLIL